MLANFWYAKLPMVRDLEASVRFYEQVLELPRVPRPAFDFPGAWFALGNQELHLIADPDLSPASRRHLLLPQSSSA